MARTKRTKFQGYPIFWRGAGLYVQLRQTLNEPKTWIRPLNLKDLEVWASKGYVPQYITYVDLHE